jgi:SWI/SNF-related matrix-associated actin-dependent regulator 1 of chromatin subfamily A
MGTFPMFALRDYQRQGADFLVQRNGLLVWEPGVGKTFAALEAAARVSARGPCLYISPASLRFQCADQAVIRDTGARAQVIERGSQPIDDKADVVFVSYDLATANVMWRELFKRKWGALVLDEAHYLKSREAKRTQAIYGAKPTSPGALFRKAAHTWALTGTPVLASPADLFTHYSRLFPFAIVNDETGNPLRYREWEDQFCLKRFTAFGEQIVGGKNLDTLADALRPFVHRLKRADVLGELPPLTIDHVTLMGEKLSLKDVTDECRAAVTRLVRGEANAKDELEPAVSRLRALIAEAKANAVIDLVTDELEGGDDKIIVFGLHTAQLHKIHKALEQRFDAVLVDGSVTPRAKAQAVSRFQTSTARVFVGQIRAAGEGLNLQAANRVIFADADWTPALNEQCIARAYRSGQQNPVRVTFVSLRGSIDESVAAACARKQKVIHALESR